MPIQYQGVLAEHRAVREAAGLFDVSHMGEIEVSGPGAEQFVERMTPNRVARLAAGQAHYSALLSERGTFLDDLLIYRLAAARFLLVVNAANTVKNLEWLRRHAEGDVEIRDASEEYALLALQGPRAATVLARLLGRPLGEVRPFRFVTMPFAGDRVLVSRTGYTGEDGFEIYLPPALAPAMWEQILEAGGGDGVSPVGLGARDTLRLEAALCLYGQDIDEGVTPWEAGLDFIVKLGKGDFVGREALVRQKAAGITRRLTGFAMTDRGIARPGHAVIQGGVRVGQVTSGTHSPSLGRAIGLTYLPSEARDPGTPLAVVIRGSEVAAEVVSIPFYRRSRS
jgi:aminomethyltransferase